jgi:acetylornithine deacetylase
LSSAEARELLARLVAFPSVAGEPNGDIAGFVRDWLVARGARCTVAADPTGTRLNLLCETGPEGSGVMLAAHMDVVAADAAQWSGDPFGLEERDGTLVGRGAADMKGFLALAMTAMADAAARPLREPLRLAVSTDEEIGCAGAPYLLPLVAALPEKPRLCLVGEPTGMRLAVAHKGKLALRATLRGEARHSSEAATAENAVVKAAQLVVALNERGRGLAASGRRDDRFAVPHSTVSVGPISGGVSVNVIPDRCTVDFELRNLPGDDPRALLPPLGDAVALEPLAEYPALDGDPAPFQDLLGVDPGPALSFGTEAGLYAKLGIPAAVCGPGDIADAHRPDESIATEQLDRCAEVLARVVRSLAV